MSKEKPDNEQSYQYLDNKMIKDSRGLDPFRYTTYELVLY